MNARTLVAALLLLLTSLHPLLSREQERVETGYASWYGGHFQGRLTANGETFDTNQLTAAHRTLPFNSIVQVTYLETGRSVVVRINDRGPFVDDRIIDLSRAAADAIGMTSDGVGMVRLEVLHLQEDTRLRSIQVGSYSVRANAEAVAEILREGELAPVIQHSANQRLYRVLIQGIPFDEVERYKEELRRLGYPNVLVRLK
ncbi:MAG: septal ring lytic transglycosylase RlpA family protein [Alkalispirochaetaceae bacterium]